MQTHELKWTPERIQRFWDHYTSNEAHAGAYFSHLFGRSLIAYVRRQIRIGIPLDYGCGRGDLLSYLADSGFGQILGIEQSPESRAAVLRRIGRRAEIHIGADIEPESADTAFLIEVVEHLDGSALDQAFDEIRRALKPGGHLVITTPNEEDLAVNKVLCPECLAVFHVMQHVRSWSAASLREYAESQGFLTLSSEATILSPHKGVLDRLWRAAKLALGATPNLIYIGKKA